MYPWIVFLHVLSAFAFAFAHGASVKVAFKLHREKSTDRLAALLELSAEYTNLMYLSIVVLLLAGIAGGFHGDWWGSGWIWLALALLVGLFFAMFGLGTSRFTALRRALGVPYLEGTKQQTAQSPASPEQIAACLAAINPPLLATLGFGALTVIVGLMILKPF